MSPLHRRVWVPLVSALTRPRQTVDEQLDTFVVRAAPLALE